MNIDLNIHRYAVLQNGERTAFLSTLLGAAALVVLRNAGGVVNVVTDQFWTRSTCFEMAQEFGRAAGAAA